MSDIYKIGVEIALAGNIVQGLETIAAKLLGVQKGVGEVEGGFARWGKAVGGIAAIMASGVLFKGMEKSVMAGGELVKQQTLLRNMGVEYKDVMSATADAQKATSAVIGTTISENLKGMRELMGVMPSLDEARKVYPQVMQAAKVLEGLTGTPAEQSLQTLAKAIELRGGGMNPQTHELDPERFAKEAEAATRAIIASGGLVNAQALLQMMKTAGPMARMTDNADVFYKGILTAMMDMGGFRAGTAMTAVGRQLLGGKMAKPTAEEMERLGLLEKGSWHGSGTGVYVKPGGLAGEDILKDPQQGVAAWMNNVLLPAFRKAGLTSNADVQQELYRVFGTETARRMAGLYVQNGAQIGRDASLYDKALPDSYQNLAKGDLGANIENLHKSFDSLLQAFGGPMVPKAIDAMQAIAGSVNSMAAVALAHPDAMLRIGEGLVALSAGLAALGTAAVISAMAAFIPGGIIAIGIVGIGTAVAALAAMNWSGVKAVLDGILNAIKGFIDGISGLAGKIGGALQGVFPSTPPDHPVGTRVPGKAYQHSYYAPPGGNPIHIQNALYLDGRLVAQNTATHLARMGDHPTQAATHDPYRSYSAPDYAFATG